MCPIDGHSLDGAVESGKEVTGESSIPRVLCPACGAADDYTSTVELRPSFSWAAFLAGGIFAVLFRNASRRRKVRCNQCEALFDIRTPLSKVSLIVFWLLVGPTIVVLVILLVALLIR